MVQACRDRVKDAFRQAQPRHPGLLLDRGLAESGSTSTQAAPTSVPTPTTREPEAPRYRRKQNVDATVVGVKGRRLTVRLHTPNEEQLSVEIPVAQSMRNPEWMEEGATIQVRIDEVDRDGRRILRISKPS